MDLQETISNHLKEVILSDLKVELEYHELKVKQIKAKIKMVEGE